MGRQLRTGTVTLDAHFQRPSGDLDRSGQMPTVSRLLIQPSEPGGLPTHPSTCSELFRAAIAAKPANRFEKMAPQSGVANLQALAYSEKRRHRAGAFSS